MASALRRRAVVVPSALALVAGGGAVAWGSSGGGSAGYRTATVTKGDVQQLLSVTGTVSTVDRAKVRFRSAGTVSAVRVTVGQAVRRGQLLATMDTGALQDAVTKAKAALAKAKATLETDSASSSDTSTPTPTASPTERGPAVGSLASAQQAAARALADAQRALAAATSACATSPAPTASASPTATPSATPSAAPTSPALWGTPGPHPTGSSSSCADSLQASLRAQQAASAAQQQLAQALASSSSDSLPDSSSDSSSSNDSSRRGSTSTAAQITLDTAAVSAAQVTLTEAQKDLAAVSLVAPLAGTVATVPWTAGGAATPSDALVILGAGAVDVTVDVPSTSIRSMKVGLPATVQADGGSRKLEGEVARIGLLPTSGSSPATYPVVVRVPSAAGLVDGSNAAVSIVVTTVRDVVTVPNSALHGTTVDVLRKGKVTRVQVETGAVGALVTEITSGVTPGQQVVLADLGAALPTSSTSERLGNQPGGFDGPPDGFKGGPVVVRRN